VQRNREEAELKILRAVLTRDIEVRRLTSQPICDLNSGANTSRCLFVQRGASIAPAKRPV